MLFAAFILERDPLQWWQVPQAFWAWVQSAGGVSALALVVFTFIALMRSQQSTEKRKDAGPLLLLFCLPLTPIALFLWFLLTTKKRWQASERAMQLPMLYFGTTVTLGFYVLYFVVRMVGPAEVVRTPGGFILRDALLNWGGMCALVMAVAPIVFSALGRMRWGRIWALARLSFKEAVRSRVVLVFSIMAMVFLFADWFVDTSKPENQVKNYVTVVFWTMTPLFLMVASILGSFNIPNDIKNQSIHTIVTKPVEKLEIVLGRFLGFGILLTVGLAAVTAVSYLYILRGVDPEAVRESFKARVPVFGSLYFSGLDGVPKDKWENAGREWDYRSYITGPHGANVSAHVRNFAIWSFDDLPASLGADGPVQLEYTFDIFRLHKGQESQAILCSFTFVDGSKDIRQIEAIRHQVNQKNEAYDAKKGSKTSREERERDKEKFALELIKEYGFFTTANMKVSDYHTESITVPGELFARLRERHKEVRQAGGKEPMLKVLVEVTSPSQLVGAARRDLYLLEAQKPFWQNFAKGVMGMWFSYLLVLGVAICCSTYLSGVISWFATLFLYFTGLFNEYVRGLAEGTIYGGGPAEAGYRLYERRPIAMPNDGTPVAAFITRIDDFYRWWLKMVLNVIPDINRFDLINYVANGFDISWGQVLFLDNFVYLAAYLLPWFVLSYYLMKFREIANPT